MDKKCIVFWEIKWRFRGIIRNA